jgi:hypothetical protein
MIPGWLLDRTAQVYKAVKEGGRLYYQEEAAFAWPCRVEPLNPKDRVRLAEQVGYSVWVLYGNTPEGDDEIVKGDKLVLEDDTTFRVTSVAPQTGPGGKEYLELTASKGE